MKTKFYILFMMLCLLKVNSNNLYAEKKQVDKNYWRHLKDGIRYDESPEGDRYNRKWADEFDKKGKRDGKGGYGKYSDKGGGRSSNDSYKRSSSGIEERRIKSEQNPPNPSIRIRTGGGGLGFLGWLFAGIGLLLLGFILYHIIKNSSGKKKDKKISSEVFEEEVEDHEDAVELPLSELELRLAAALRENNFREAIRIYFIFIIKALREKNWIIWERKKTNTLYLYEMRSRAQYPIFSQSVMLFEFIWYGKQEIDQETYKKMEPLFKKMLNEIEKNT